MTDGSRPSPPYRSVHPRDIPWCQEHGRAMVQRDGRGWYCPTALLSEKSRSGSRAEKVAGSAPTPESAS